MNNQKKLANKPTKTDVLALMWMEKPWKHTVSAFALADRICHMFIDLYSEAENGFLNAYRNAGGLEEMIMNIDSIVIKEMSDFADQIVVLLRNCDILEYDAEDFIQKSIMEYGDELDELKDDIFQFLEEISENTAQLDAYRTARRKSRGRFIGYSAEGMIKAGAANLAIGTLHGTFNLIGKGITAMGNSMKKMNKLSESEPKFKKIFNLLCIDMYDSFVDQIEKKGFPATRMSQMFEREKRAKTLLENAVAANYQNDQMLEVVDKSLSLYVYENELAFGKLLDMMIHDEHTPADNMNNVSNLMEFMGQWTNLTLSDEHMIDGHYELILKQFIVQNMNKQHLLDAVCALDELFKVNADRQEDMKREVCYSFPELAFLLKDPTPRMVGSAFIDLALHKYIAYGPLPFGSRFYAAGDAKLQELANNAINEYTQSFDTRERLVFLYDDSVFESGKAGFFVSEKAVYGPGFRVRVDAIQSVTFRVSMGVNYMQINQVHEVSLSLMDKPKIEWFKQFMIDLFTQNHAQLLQSPQIPRIAQQLSSNSAKMLHTAKIDMNLEPIHNIANLFAYIRGSSIKDNIYYLFNDEKSYKKYYNVCTTYVNLTPPEQPLLLFDNTTFGSAKDGFFITNWRFYYKNFMSSPQAIAIPEIQSISISGNDFIINHGQHTVSITLISDGERDEFLQFIQTIIQMLNGKLS
jgi:hypothetical protein